MFKKIFNNFDEIFIEVCLAVISVIVILLVFIRNTMAVSLPHLEEFNQILFVWFLYVAIIACTRRNEHIRANVIDMWLSAKGRIVVTIVADIVCLMFFLAMVYACYKYEVFNFEITRPSTWLRMPSWAKYSILLISFIAMSFFGARHVIRGFNELKELNKTDAH